MKRTIFRTMLSVTATIGAVTALSAGMGPGPGDQRRWALDFRVRLEQPENPDPIEIDLSGEWISTISAVRPGEYDVQLQITDVHLKGDRANRAQPERIEQAQRRMSRPFWATYAADGALLRVHFYRDMIPADRNLLQMIATGIQLVRPDAVKTVWTVVERDGAGSYLAAYNRLEPNVVMKRKLKYVRTDGSPGAPADGLQVAVEQSELRFSLDPEGEIIAVDAKDRVRMRVSFGNSKQLTAMTETRLTDFRKSRAPELIGSLSRAGREVESAAIVTHKPDPEQVRAEHDSRLLEGHTTESLLQTAMANGDDPALGDRLAALFRQRPGSVATAMTLLRKNGPRTKITGALGSAGTPAAIDALGSLARDGAASAALRVDALTALIMVEHPSVQAMRIGPTLLDETDARVRSAAELMSGALARAGREAHPAEAEAIDSDLIARYKSSADTREESELLAGLGNSAGPSVLPVIKDALHDPRGPIRAAAARALRLGRGAEVDGLLSSALTSDPDAAVRSAAIFAASFRRPIDPQLADALVQAGTSDAVDSVRSNAVSLLRQDADASPRMREGLSWIAEHDSNNGIRRLAREALASGSSH